MSTCHGCGNSCSNCKKIPPTPPPLVWHGCGANCGYQSNGCSGCFGGPKVLASAVFSSSNRFKFAKPVNTKYSGYSVNAQFSTNNSLGNTIGISNVNSGNCTSCKNRGN